jgi:DNA-binding PadR family transcriptional regulator
MGLQGALAALLIPGRAHGYQLQATLEAELGPLWVTRTSQVYLTLGRMVRDGLVTTRRVRQATRPDRQLLALTSAGREVAYEWLLEPGPAEEIIVRLAVARLVAPNRFEELAGSIADERSAVLQRLRALRTQSEQGFQHEAVEAEILRVQGEIRWLAAVRERHAEILRRPPASRPAAATTRYA